MKIFLTGFMGCGKTTMGRKLALQLNCSFIDLDNQFEAREGVSIAQYFTQYGEEAFRREEAALLRSAQLPDNCVISTGGGLPCFFGNMAWMKANGRVIYIKLPPGALAGRLEHGRNERPLLHGKHGEDLVKFIAEKLAEREPFYLQAHVVAEGLNLTAGRLKDMLVNS